MQRRGSEPLQRLAMAPRPIPLVPAQIISGQKLIERHHPTVASHLGNDRGSRNRETGAVTLDDRFLWQRGIELQGIDQVAYMLEL